MGGGGGFFNLPAQLRRNAILNGGQGFQAFSVKDDLNLTPEGAPRAAAAAKPDADPQTSEVSKASEVSRRTIRRINLQIPRGADPETAWEQHLSTQTESPAALRETVRSLWREKKYKEIIGLVMAALRNRQAQPWMYEALSLAMQAAGASTEDLERAVMSAVEFAQTPADLMFIAAYLENTGLERRALEVLRQVSRIQPLMPEPYVQGLRLAEKLREVVSPGRQIRVDAFHASPLLPWIQAVHSPMVRTWNASS